MKFKISSWKENTGMVYYPSVKQYSIWPFYSYEDIDNKGRSNTRKDALSRIEDYCKTTQATKELKFYSEYLIIK